MSSRTFNNLKVFLLFLLICIVLPKALAQEAKQRTILPDSLISAAREIISQQKYCALVTIDSVGRPSIRTMNPFAPESDMTVWMATNSRSRKVGEIRRNPSVCLYYADHSRATGYVSITGKAYLVDDMQEKLRHNREYWKQAFPDWKYLLLIKVVAEKLEVVNYKRGVVGDGVTGKVPTVRFPAH